MDRRPCTAVLRTVVLPEMILILSASLLLVVHVLV